MTLVPEPSIQDPQWQLKYIEEIDGGIDLAQRPKSIGDTFWVRLDNLRFDQRRLLVDKGYRKFGPTVRGKPRAAYQFFQRDGSSRLVLVTNATFYTYDQVNNEWEYVSNGTSTALSANAAASAASITVSSINGFSSGDHIGVALDDATQHQTTINGAPSGSTITLTDALPSAAASGNAVVNSVVLAGDDDKAVALETWAATDAMYFTNGVDTPKKYNGTVVSDIANLPGSSFTCAILVLYENHLLMMNTEEGGVASPQRVRWSDIGVDDTWIPAAGNLAGFNDLYTREDFIVAAARLGPYMILYRERSIVRMEFVGRTNQRFDFQDVVGGEGALIQDAVVDLGGEHLLIGNANVYRYAGDFEIRPVGDRIFRNLFSQEGILDPTNRITSFVIFVEELDETWIMFPETGQDGPSTMYRLVNSTEAWSFRRFPDKWRGFGFYQRDSTVTWEQSSGTWAEQTSAWNSRAFSRNSPTILLCGDDLQVYEYDFTAPQDDGTAVSFTAETKDFFIPNYKMRIDRFDFYARGASVLIEYSIDEGETWTTWETVSLSSSFSLYRVWKQFLARTLRFRFSGTGGGFGLEWYAFRFSQETLV